MDQSQYDQYGADQFQYGQYGGIDVPQEDPYGIDFGFEAPETARNSIANLMLPLQPPNLQVQAQLDAEGNWFYPSSDQANHDLRIQCEAFRAGAASRPGAALPLRFDQVPQRPPHATPRALPRKRLNPVSRRTFRPVKRKPAGGRKKKVSVAQICVCHEKTSTPKRPPNAFMLFRTKFQPQLVKLIEEDPSLRRINKNGREASLQAAVSSLASEWWNEAKDRGEDKQYWDLAEQEKQSHAARNPDYKYQAGRKYQLSWGDESCRCGAFQANEAKRRQREADRLHPDRNESQYDYEEDEYEEQEGDGPYPSATIHRGLKRPTSRGSLNGPPVKRRGGSTAINPATLAGHTADFDNNSVFPMESYGGDVSGAAYGGGPDNDTGLQNTNQTGNMFAPRIPYVPRAQSGTGVSPTRRRGSKQSTAFPVNLQQTEFTEDDLLNMVADFGDDSGNQYNAGASQSNGFTYGTNQEQTPDENTRMRDVSGGSFGSLFDMDGYDAQRSSGSRSKTSSRGGQTQPGNASGPRRSPRRSRG